MSIAWFAFEYFVFHDNVATREHGLSDTAYFAALVRTIVDAHVMGFRADRLLTVRIEDHDVGIGADRDRAFSRKHSKDLGSSRGCQFDESIQADSILNDTSIVDEAHAVLNTGTAVRNFAEVVAPKFLLFLEAERAVIRRDHLKIVSA